MNVTAWWRELRQEFDEVRRYRELFDSLVKRELDVRYKNSRVGVAWSLANPIVRALILTVVFEYILQIGVQNYSAYLLAAFFPWTYFLTGVLDACDSVSQRMALVKKVYFPRELLPLATTWANLKHFLLSLCVLGVYLIGLYGSYSINQGRLILPPAEILLLPLLIVMQTLLIGGLALFLSALNVFLEDTKFLVAVVLDLMFYAVPIVYFLEQVRATSAIPESLRSVVYTVFLLNPMTVILTSYRSFLLVPAPLGKNGFGFDAGMQINTGVPWPYFWLAFAVCIFVFLAGYTFFNRRKWRFVEQL
jgi:ABC-2 type transport system permease protein